MCVMGLRTENEASLWPPKSSISTAHDHTYALTKGKVFRCMSCLQWFDTPGSLKQHKHSSAHCKGSLYKCPYCEKKFDTARDLERHTICTHSDRKPYTCVDCGKGFSTKGTLKAHAYIHTAEKQFVCPFPNCGKRFHQQPTLSRHMCCHREQKRHLCRDCGRGFHTPKALQNHAAVHKGRKPHVCPHCSKVFKNPASLTMHQMVHQEQKPHICSVCYQGFKSAIALKKHMRSTKGHSNRGGPSTGFDSGSLSNAELESHQLPDLERTPSPTENCPSLVSDEVSFGWIDSLPPSDSEASERKFDAFKSSLMNCPVCVYGFIDVHELQEHLIFHSYAYN